MVGDAVNRRFLGVLLRGLEVGEHNDPSDRSPEARKSPKLGGSRIYPTRFKKLIFKTFSAGDLEAFNIDNGLQKQLAGEFL
jgi:hypothetical protein